MAYLPVPYIFQNATGTLPLSQLDADLASINLKVRSVKDFGAVGDGVTDDTAAIMAAGVAIQADGGGTLLFDNAVYKIWTATPTAPLLPFTSLNGVTLLGNGCTLLSGQVNGPLVSVVKALGCSNVVIQNFNLTGSNTTITHLTGERFLEMQDTCRNVVVENVGVTNGNTVVWGQAASDGANPLTPSCIGFRATNIYLIGTQYGFNLFNLQDALITGIYSVNCGRTYYVQNCKNHRVWIESQPGWGSSDILIKVYTDITQSTERNTTSNIHVNYKTIGRYPSSGNQGADTGMVALEIQATTAYTVPVPGTLSDITVEFTGTCTADKFPNLITIMKFDSASNGDTNTNNHVIRNLKFSGTMLGCNNLSQAGIVLFSNAYGGMTWTADVIENIRIENMRQVGAAPSGGIVANAQGFSTTKQSLVLDNVNIDGTYTETNVAAATARISRRALVASNVDNSDGQGTWVPVDASGAALSFTVTTARWFKRGREFVITFNITFPATADGTAAAIGGVPFTDGAISVGSVQANSGNPTSAVLTGATVTLCTAAGAAVVNSALSTAFVRCTIVGMI